MYCCVDEVFFHYDEAIRRKGARLADLLSVCPMCRILKVCFEVPDSFPHPFMVPGIRYRCFDQVLSHYDEVKKEGAKLTLGQGGRARDDAMEEGDGEGEKTKVLESLKVEVKDASEYYTTEEMAKFKKPKKVGIEERARKHGWMPFWFSCSMFHNVFTRLCVNILKVFVYTKDSISTPCAENWKYPP